MLGPSGVSIGKMRPYMRGMHVAHFEAGALAAQTALVPAPKTPACG